MKFNRVKDFIFLPYITVVAQGRSEDSFTLLLCLAIAEKGEVSRSDGGVENLSVTVSLNPLAYGAPPIFPLRETQGERVNLSPVTSKSEI